MISTTLEDAWMALTDLATMKKWYFDNIPDFKAEIGFETAFLITNEGRNFTHQWKVTEVELLHKITYEWTFEEYPGKSISRFIIEKQPDGIKVRLEDHVLEDYPTGIPEFKRESAVGGWNYFLNDRLKPFLEGTLV